MVLGVDREDPAGSDQQVIDVCALLSDRDRVQTAPLPPELRELPSHGLFTVRADTPGSLVGVHAEEPREGRAEGGRLTKFNRPRAGSLAWPVQSEVDPRQGDAVT